MMVSSTPKKYRVLYTTTSAHTFKAARGWSGGTMVVSCFSAVFVKVKFRFSRDLKRVTWFGKWVPGNDKPSSYLLVSDNVPTGLSDH